MHIVVMDSSEKDLVVKLEPSRVSLEIFSEIFLDQRTMGEGMQSMASFDMVLIGDEKENKGKLAHGEIPDIDVGRETIGRSHDGYPADGVGRARDLSCEVGMHCHHLHVQDICSSDPCSSFPLPTPDVCAY